MSGNIITLSRCLLLTLGAAMVLGKAFAQVDKASSLDALVDARIAAEETRLCVVAGTITAAGTLKSVRCAEGLGSRLKPDAVIEIGSISKAFLGVLLADASLRGEVKLDDPLAKHLSPDATLPSFGSTTITLLDLATHNAGVPRLPPGFAPVNPADPYAALNETSLLAALAASKLERNPGARYEYSNFGAMLLSLALSRASGKPFDVLLAERIATPLRMTSTFVVVPESQRGRIGQGHAPDGRPVPPWTIDARLAGVGGIRSTLDDMLIFAAASLTPPDNALGRAIALSQRMQRAIPGGEIGLLWHRRASSAGSTIVWHNGGTGGSRTMLAIDAARGIAAFAAADTALSVDDLPLHLVDSASPLKKRRIAVAFDLAWLDEVAGHYALSPTFTLTFVRKGERLFAQAPQQPEFEVFAEDRDRIFWKAIDAQAVFVRDESGRITGMNFMQAGRTLKAPRLP